MDQTRRKLLINSLALGCSAAASPLVTPMSFASAPSDNRLVVIILRGAMDGLDVVRPLGDRDFKKLRPSLLSDGQMDLDGFYALHPALSDLYPMWKSGELAFAHATSTPYRDGRSHFDGQDVLEAGVAPDFAFGTKNSGWLNRLLTLFPKVEMQTAFSVGQEDMILMKGEAPISSWAPGRNLPLSDAGARLMARVFEQDELFHSSASIATDLSAESLAELMDDGDDASMGQMMAQNMRAANLSRRAQALAEFSARKLNQDTRIAAFSLGGWDTHRNQNQVLSRILGQLQSALLTLKGELGPNWQKTAVLCMTEFGRTARENGSKGTDHGTGGAMIMAGGAIRGGKVFGDWPGLGRSELYEGRDLMPTADVRSYAAAAMRGLFGIEQSALESTVFPGLDLVSFPKIIL